ncbi:EAL domain-containing protein [Croceicoccus sediminis]|uniref:EAL domain-containing protein n=1 Tax=Croceicoccus sediminis TaxID=2571150 RepID=UPI00118468E2|nr:EAL domain-containing protein [Croceicoccus sediminis]
MKFGLRLLSARRASSQELVRLYQLAASAVAAFILGLAALPHLIDHAPRWFGSAMMVEPISGQIVLIDTGSGQNFSDESVAERQAQAVRIASKAGAEAIFIEGQFAESDPGISALANAISATSTPVTIGWPLAYTADENYIGVRVDRRASFPDVTETAQANRQLMTGFVREAESPITVAGKRWSSFSAAISGVDYVPGVFPIDYRHRASDLKVYSIDDLAGRSKMTAQLRGKRVVIASITSLQRNALVPRDWRVPIIFVDLLAAETLISGVPFRVPTEIGYFFAIIMLYIAALLPRRMRRKTYAATAGLMIAVPLFVAPFGPIINSGAGLCVLFVYGGLRLRSGLRERAAGVERLSGLPNFHSLEDDFTASKGRLIIAKVENYEEILASLESTHHADFVKQIAQRLSIGGSTQIYTDTTGHFAWFDELEHAKSHVAGLLALTSAPIVTGDRTLDFNCAFGLLDCTIDKPRQAISATIVAADRAASRPTHISYVSEQDGFDANWQLSLLASLGDAMEREQIYLAFQPQCRLADNRIIGVEALVRWRHPERGVISPSQFIPQIERAGRLKPLTAHTLRLAARAADRILSTGIRVSVNVSATLVADDDFVPFVHENILAGGGRPSAITIEITETARTPDIERAARNLEKLRSIGYHIALDDFGTGEANLSLLVALPCDELKIDRSFVILSQHSDRARMVIGALEKTTSMADMRLIVEGIETEDDRNTMLDLGCELGQGYLLGKPQLLTQFIHLLGSQVVDEPTKLTLY